MSKWIGSIRHDCALRHQGRIGLGLGAAATTTQTLSVAGLRAFSIGKEATPPVDAIGPRIGARVQVKKEKKRKEGEREKGAGQVSLSAIQSLRAIRESKVRVFQCRVHVCCVLLLCARLSSSSAARRSYINCEDRGKRRLPSPIASGIYCGL